MTTTSTTTTMQPDMTAEIQHTSAAPGVAIAVADANDNQDDNNQDDIIIVSASEFSPRELEIIARRQNTTVRGLCKHWIVQRGNSYYIIGPDGEYDPPVTGVELDAAVRERLVRTPRFKPERSDDTEIAPDGHITYYAKVGDNYKEYTGTQLAKREASIAVSIATTMLAKRSYFDPAQRIFYEKVCRQRNDIKPVYHAQIDEWLTLLGGDRSELLKDWIAGVGQLDKPICALYLYGPTNSGKTMLVSGLARLWGHPAVDFDSANESFNSAIANCPILVADEEISSGITSGFLRRIIGNENHRLRRKGLPETSIEVYFRLIIAANNPNLLQFEREDINPEGVDAIIARVLFIDMRKAAVEYIESLGCRAGTDDWVSGDKIAEHALWLRANRNIKMQRKYLVEGVAKDASRYIGTAAAIKWPVLEWICKAMIGVGFTVKQDQDNDRKNKGKTAYLCGLQFGGGSIYVNTSYVKDNWETVLGDKQVPTINKIGRTLKPLTKPDPDGLLEKRFILGSRRADFYNIDPRFVLEAAQALQIGDPEDFAALINEPRAYLTSVRGGLPSSSSSTSLSLVACPGESGKVTSKGLFEKI